MSKLLWVLSYVAVAGLCLFAGFTIAAHQAEQRVSAQASAQAVAVSRPMAIAVVNEDAGVTEPSGQKMSYAQSILNALPSSYKLTPYSLAMKGLTDGAYDAVVEIPSDFSAKAASGSGAAPQQINLPCQINPNLPESRYIEAYTAAAALRDEVSASLSYLYVYTLYDNLHGAQDKMGALLTSNDQDIATAKTFQAQDFPNTLNLADLPQITVEPQSVSYDAYTKAVQDLGNQMSQTYLDSYNNAKAAYAAMTAQLSTDIQTSKDAGDTWQNDARDWLNTANEYQTKQNEWEASVDGWLNGTAGVNPTLRTYQDDFLSMQASQQALTDNATILYGAIGNVTNLNAINTAMSNYSTALDTWSTAVDNYLASPTGSAPTRQDIRVPSVSNQTVDAIQTAYTNALKGLAGNTSDLQNIMNAHTAYIAAGGSSQTQVEDPLYPTGATTDAMNTLENDLNAILPYDSPAIPTIAQYSLETQYDTVSADLTAFNNNSDAVEQTAGTYDPLAYLTDADKAKVGSIISSYATELGVVQSALTTAQSNNIQQVTDAYNSYAKSTSDTRASVYQAYTDELQRVNAARDSLSSALQDTASTNKGLIGSFAGILPETRNGAQVNSKSAQFVANPVLLSQPDVRAAGNAAAFTLSSPWVLLIISVAILIAALVIRAVRNRRGEGGRHEARG